MTNTRLATKVSREAAISGDGVMQSAFPETTETRETPFGFGRIIGEEPQLVLRTGAMVISCALRYCWVRSVVARSIPSIKVDGRRAAVVFLGAYFLEAVRPVYWITGFL